MMQGKQAFIAMMRATRKCGGAAETTGDAEGRADTNVVRFLQT